MNEYDFDIEVSKAHLESAGWSLDNFFHSNPFNCHFVYVRDYRSNHVELFTINRADFETIDTPYQAVELAGALAQTMRQRLGRKCLGNEAQLLTSILSSYLKQTKTFRIWKNQVGADARLHALINIYSTDVVRPFIARVLDTVLSVEEVLSSTDGVREMDMANHPEWFLPLSSN